MSLELNFKVFDERGADGVLQDKLDSGWNLLVFLRHADCIECQLITHELNAIFSALSQWAVTVTMVGNCRWERLTEIRATLQIHPEINLFTEPSLDVHKALGLRNSIVGGFGPKALFNILRGTQNGFQQKLSLGENMGQQSGLFLVDPNGVEVWGHRSNHLGDIPSHGDVLEQVLKNCALEALK